MLADERPQANIKDTISRSAEGKTRKERAKLGRKQSSQTEDRDTVASPTGLGSSDRSQPP